MTMETETMDTKPCTGEGCPKLVAPSWGYNRNHTEAQRAELRAAGIYPDAKGGACKTCVYRASDRPEPRRGWRRRAVLEDWQWLHEQGELDPNDPLTVRVRQAAPRLGYDRPESLERLVQRAVKSGELVTAA